MQIPKICFISESLNNPSWSACNFFLDGLKQICDNNVIGVKHTENFPSGYDWYIDVDSARTKPPVKNKKTCALIFDLFDTDCDQSWRLAMAKEADVIMVTNECSRKAIRQNNIQTPCFLITFGIHEKIWHKQQVEKKYDSVFIGNIIRKSSARRVGLIENLRKAGYGIVHKHLNCFLEDNARLINEARIGLEIPNEGYDNFGIRAMETIACGLPLLTIKDPIIEKIIPEGLATYYEPSNLVEKYTEVYKNLEENTKKADILRNYFMQKFTYKHIAKRIIKILNGEYNESEMFCS